MSVKTQILDWDSNFFGFPVASFICNNIDKFRLLSAIQDYKTKGVKLIYLFLNPDDTYGAHVVNSVNAKLVDKKVTFETVIKESFLDCTQNIRPFITKTTQFNQVIESLSWQSGEYSRFFLDKNFSDKTFKKLYSEWLKNSLNGQLARCVLVFKEKDKEIGLLTLGEKDGIADIGLLAVDKSNRGNKIGQKLLEEAKCISLANGYSKLQVATQRDNNVACNFYSKCGLQIVKESHIYHLWL